MKKDFTMHNYIIKYYVTPCVILVSICFLLMLTTSAITFKEKSFSIGIGLLLFTDVMMATFTIISMISTYREISRLHNKEYKYDIVDAIDGIQNRLNEIEGKNNNDIISLCLKTKMELFQEKLKQKTEDKNKKCVDEAFDEIIKEMSGNISNHD